MKRIDHHGRRHIARGQRSGDLLANLIGAPFGEVALLAQAVLTQDLGECVAIEDAAGTLESGVGADCLGNRRVRQVEAEFVRIGVDRGGTY
jgi:hypothetical protein